MAPTSKILAHSQTRSLNASSKWCSTIIIACGRSRMVLSFLAVGSEPSVPCRSRFVYQMDKVEIRTYAKAIIACGGMVLSIYLYFVFALSERKNEIQKKMKYRSAEVLIA